MRDRRRAARRRAHQLARSLRARTGQAKQQVAERTAELATLAEQVAADAARVARNARRQLNRAGSQASGKPTRLVDDLETTIGRTQQVIGQARTRLAGQVPDGATRLVSLHDPTPARSSRGGWASRWSSATRRRSPTTRRGRARRPSRGRQPRRCAPAGPGDQADQPAGRPGPTGSDRRPGYGEAAIDEELHTLGVKQVAIPRKGTPSAARQAHEHTRSFRRLVTWRTGSEGRISHLKHRYGRDRTLMDGIDGARIWCGQGVFAHNLVKISGLIETKQAG